MHMHNMVKSVSARRRYDVCTLCLSQVAAFRISIYCWPTFRYLSNQDRDFSCRQFDWEKFLLCVMIKCKCRNNVLLMSATFATGMQDNSVKPLDDIVYIIDFAPTHQHQLNRTSGTIVTIVRIRICGTCRHLCICANIYAQHANTPARTRT